MNKTLTISFEYDKSSEKTVDAVVSIIVGAVHQLEKLGIKQVKLKEE